MQGAKPESNNPNSLIIFRKSPLPPLYQRVPKAFGIWKREVRRDLMIIMDTLSLDNYYDILSLTCLLR
jgi:hypothetical protein